jgi:hypothetical protein
VISAAGKNDGPTESSYTATTAVLACDALRPPKPNTISETLLTLLPIAALVSDLDASTQNRIAGVVLYGNTRNQENSGKIPNFPPENVLTICAATDGVCGSTLTVTAGHFSYSDDVPDAVDFLEGRINVFDGEGGDVGGEVPEEESTFCRLYPYSIYCRD